MSEPITENKMGTAPVMSLLLKMSLPVILSTAVQALYNIVGGIFVAMISEKALSAITYKFNDYFGLKCCRNRKKQKNRCGNAPQRLLFMCLKRQKP